MPPLIKKACPWTDGTIRIDMKEGAPKKVPGKLLPPFGIHRVVGLLDIRDHEAIPPTPSWVLTHLTTGLQIVKLPSESACMRVGEYLRIHHVSAFRNETRGDILEVLPKWIPGWIKRCMEAGDFIEPTFPDLPE